MDRATPGSPPSPPIPRSSRVHRRNGLSRWNRDRDLEKSHRCTGGGCETLPPRLFTVGLDGAAALEVPLPEAFLASSVEWSPDGERLLIASIDGVVSIDVASGEAVIHSRGDLNLEWSYSELSWQSLGG